MVSAAGTAFFFAGCELFARGALAGFGVLPAAGDPFGGDLAGARFGDGLGEGELSPDTARGHTAAKHPSATSTIAA